MSESELDEYNLPASLITRLIKEAIPEGAIVSKEARTIISRAASIFVIFLTTQSTDIASEKKHKTLSAAHVLEALEEWQFNDYLEPLKEDLEKFKKVLKDKKEQKLRSKEAAEAEKEQPPVMEVDATEPTVES